VKVLRGGSWNNHQDNARASYRNNNNPDNRNNNIGFRLACVLPHRSISLTVDKGSWWVFTAFLAFKPPTRLPTTVGA